MQPDIGILRELDGITQRRIDGGTLAGAAYAVAYRGKTVFENALGYADIENRVPMGPDTVLRLASMTKPITGVAVMQLAEQGQLSLDDPVSAYIPGFEKMQVAVLDAEGRMIGQTPAKTQIRIRDLLNHTSGLGSGPVGDAAWKAYGLREGDTLDTLMPRFAAQILDFEPRTRTAYSWTQAFDVAAWIVQQVSGMAFERCVQERILGPLGCRDTTYTPDAGQWARLMKMYDTKDGALVEVDMGGRIFGSVPLSYHAAGAGMVGTLNDYMKFAAMLYARGEGNGARILRPETVDRMAAPSVGALYDPARDAETWGLSMRVIGRTTPTQRLCPGCFGWSGAYGTHFFIDPQHALYAVYMTNHASAGGAGAATAREFEAVIARSVT